MVDSLSRSKNSSVGRLVPLLSWMKAPILDLATFYFRFRKFILCFLKERKGTK